MSFPSTPQHDVDSLHHQCPSRLLPQRSCLRCLPNEPTMEDFCRSCHAYNGCDGVDTTAFRPMSQRCALPLILYRCNNRKMWQAKWFKEGARGAVILYATFNFICMSGAWLIRVVSFTGASKKAEDGWRLGQALPSPLGYRSWWSPYPSSVVSLLSPRRGFEA